MAYASKKNDVKPRYWGENQNAISNKKLVAVIGTGVSRSLSTEKADIFSWTGLVENGLDYCKHRSCITELQYQSWEPHLKSDDIDDLLSAAEFVGRKLNATSGDLYARWLEDCFANINVSENDLSAVINYLHELGVPIATLNYDTLLEQVTGLPTINFSDMRKVTQWVRRETDGILHLHGVWHDPASCVLGIRDYHSAALSEVRQFIQRNLSTFGRLLFIGCGDTFSDPNFSALISWMKSEIKGASPLHYSLVRQSELSKRLGDPSWQGFVEPISYGEEFHELPGFLKSVLPSADLLQAISQSLPPSTETQVQDDKSLTEYRSFLLRDCGQMTIEGIRADIDTAQRKFDLEKLFVPLNVLPAPPEFPLSDKRREEKLKKWHAENAGPTPFGEAFTNNQRVALLALPGGGKTLLLKRLAVAYADEERRGRSDDFLPDLDIYPVLIRCREWREYISRPIPFILGNISTITGQAGLENFYDALTPLLKAGKVVLLVDGLDEIHNDADRATFAENLEKFLDTFKKVRLVVTSREAGFALVAPTIARFCSRWKLAPLDESTISSLCVHWHNLMAGGTPEALEEADDVASRLLKSPALRRLAENPLLLTMLLVVKHGAGRLPPDRVSLYSRAVEVLLDTWNIKGHEALNTKEALPQLSYVAYELMKRGKQTATQSELISLLEEAREKVPRIRMYAKDTPVEFLRRVELRSSLLMEAGYQLEGAKAVPFYQFRHLTFQEYLAAEAAVDGNYRVYSSNDNLLTPLGDYLDQEEWKEVIPMATVLARRQAEPIIIELISKIKPAMQALKDGDDSGVPRNAIGSTMPPPVALLLQCLAEETEASPTVLSEALFILSVFAKGCRDNRNWDSLVKGLYGEEFLKTIFSVNSKEWPQAIWLRNTKAVALALTKTVGFWKSTDGRNLIDEMLAGSDDQLEIILLTLAGAYWGSVFSVDIDDALFDSIVPHIHSENEAIWEPAIWVLGLFYSNGWQRPATTDILDRLLILMLQEGDKNDVASFALSKVPFIDRSQWQPVLTSDEKSRVSAEIERLAEQNFANRKELGWFIVAFYAQNIVGDQQLYDALTAADNVGYSGSLTGIVQELEKSLHVPEAKRIPTAPRRRRAATRA